MEARELVDRLEMPPPSGMPDAAGMLAGMDPRLAAEAEKMWKQLEDMSASDPEVGPRRS